MRSTLRFEIPTERRRAMSSSTVARLCCRPTARASRSTKDCTPRLTLVTPHRSPLQLPAIEHRRCHSAQVDVIDLLLKLPTHLNRYLRSSFNIGANPVHI